MAIRTFGHINGSTKDPLAQVTGRIQNPTTYPDHENDEEIPIGKFPFKQFYGLRFQGTNFDPHYRNIFTGAVCQKSHHDKGEGAKTKGTYMGWPPAYAFCLEFIDHPTDGRVRCGQQYMIKSGGCGNQDHGHTETTEAFRKMGRNQPITWGEFKDPILKQQQLLPPPVVDNYETRRLAALDQPEPWTALKSLERKEAYVLKAKKQTAKMEAQTAKKNKTKTKGRNKN